MKNNICTFVVNDNLVNGLNSISTYLNVNYKGDKESSEEKVTEMVEANSIGDNSSLYYISKMGVEATTARAWSNGFIFSNLYGSYFFNNISSGFSTSTVM